jgi:hypothetical protein
MLSASTDAAEIIISYDVIVLQDLLPDYYVFGIKVLLYITPLKSLATCIITTHSAVKTSLYCLSA